MHTQYDVGDRCWCVVEENQSFGSKVRIDGVDDLGLIPLGGYVNIEGGESFDSMLRVGQRVECIVIGFVGKTMYLSIRQNHLENPEMVVEEYRKSPKPQRLGNWPACVR